MKTDLTIGAYIIHNEKLLLIFHNKLQIWLPPGGHIEANETPDEAVKREVQEEVGLEVTLPQQTILPYEPVKQCALPFHTDVHNVGDHDHYGLFYICKPKDTEVKLNVKEAKDFCWVTEQELEQGDYRKSIKEIGKEAFKISKNLS